MCACVCVVLRTVQTVSFKDGAVRPPDLYGSPVYYTRVRVCTHRAAGLGRSTTAWIDTRHCHYRTCTYIFMCIYIFYFYNDNKTKILKSARPQQRFRLAFLRPWPATLYRRAPRVFRLRGAHIGTTVCCYVVYKSLDTRARSGGYRHGYHHLHTHTDIPVRVGSFDSRRPVTLYETVRACACACGAYTDRVCGLIIRFFCVSHSSQGPYPEPPPLWP